MPCSFSFLEGATSASYKPLRNSQAAARRRLRSASSSARRASSASSALSNSDTPCLRSTDRAFEADRDQLLRLDREFHRQLLQHVAHEAVDDQRRRLFRRQAPLQAIEQLVFGDLR